MELDRLPPQSLEAEKAVLGSLWLDNSLVPRVAGLLSEADFYAPQHQLTFRAICGLVTEGKPVDAVTLPDRLRAEGTFERVGWLELLAMLEGCPSAAMVDHYAGIVREKAQRRRLIKAATDMARKAYDETEGIADTVAAAQEDIGKVCADSNTEDDDLEDIAVRARAEVEGLHQGSARWSTGIDWLDGITGGLTHDQGWVVMGKSGHCKTAMALNIALGVMGQGGTVCFFRWEERREVMVLRLASLLSGVPYTDVRRREATPHDLQTFLNTVTTAGRDYRTRLFIYRGLNLAQIEAAIVKRQPWLCVYDTIQAASMQIPKASEWEGFDKHVGRLSGAIAGFRGRYRHASLIVSQLNSDGQERESKAIREDNDVAFDIFWPHKEDTNREEDKIVVRFRKNRPGGVEPATVCHINPGTQRFGAKLPDDAERAFLGIGG